MATGNLEGQGRKEKKNECHARRKLELMEVRGGGRGMGGKYT